MKRSKPTVYFDNAATTFPKPREVIDRTLYAMQYACGNPGRSSHRIAMKAAETVYGCRSKISALFNGTEEGVIFTSSATHALNLAIKTVLHRGDHVLISDIEHNSVIRPISALAERGMITYDVYTAHPQPDRAIASISSLIRSNTAAVIACHHSNICNLVQPIKSIGELCRSRGILLIVDAAQSAGIEDIDLRRDCIDVLCAPGHKGLYGIPGSGFALFGEDFCRGKLKLSTFTEGGNGIRSRDTAMPDFLPERLEAGTLAVPAISALSAGADFLRRHGLGTIRQREKELFSVLRRELNVFGDKVTVYGDGTPGGILLFSSRRHPSEELAAALDRYGICVRAGLHCAPTAHKKLGTPEDGAVRVSFGAFNRKKEIFHLLNVLDSLLKN
ncbi:MAG: aminotransferase class V-fold PLP-dependent enzyme [Clostridia bacterium]|nr:aminotransferase class V-fold PLP-dependent enzyme [Clostridia bacterium]